MPQYSNSNGLARLALIPEVLTADVGSDARFSCQGSVISEMRMRQRSKFNEDKAGSFALGFLIAYIQGFILTPIILYIVKDYIHFLVLYSFIHTRIYRRFITAFAQLPASGLVHKGIVVQRRPTDYYW